MKWTCVLILSVAVSFAQDFATGQAARLVIGQPNGFTAADPNSTAAVIGSAAGVAYAGNTLFIADSNGIGAVPNNNRVLIFPNLSGMLPPPTAQLAYTTPCPICVGTASVVLGQPDFSTTTENLTTTPNNIRLATAVASDGIHLVVADTNHNRVMIWNSIPTTKNAPADVVVGQPDMVSGVPNNAFTATFPDSLVNSTPNFIETPVLCTMTTGNDANGNPQYPTICNATLNFPRFALSDGKRLFIADGGNDRILEFLNIPTTNGASADTIIGQIGGAVDQATDAADSMNTPTSLAFDGTNLYVADPYNRRVTVYTVAPNILPYQAVVNSANPNIFATGSVILGGTINNGDIVTITINTTQYAYTVKATDSLTTVIQALVAEINDGSGDPNVIASEDDVNSAVALTARLPGPQGDNVTYSVTTSTNSLITATAANANLAGGGNAGSVAPGTIVTITGQNLASQTASADLSQPTLPTTLGGAQVYFNGVRSPLTFVSPTQINAQMPWEFTSTTSINAFVLQTANGGQNFTSPVAVTMVGANPGIFGQLGTTNPELGLAFHFSQNATAIVSVDGSINAGDVATVTIRNRAYNYTVQGTDTLDTVRDALIAQINQDPEVTATEAGVFDRIIITARVQGPDGNGIPITASASSGADITMSAFDSSTCCANVAGAPLTQANPAKAGELIIFYTTGMGLPELNSGNQQFIVTGAQYPIGAPNTAPPLSNFANALAGGSTADVIEATLLQGAVGLFEVVLHLSPSLSSNPNTSVTIAQGSFVSNPVVIPVVSQ